MRDELRRPVLDFQNVQSIITSVVTLRTSLLLQAASPKDVFLASLERCADRAGFLHAFYTRFLASSEEIRAKFRYTDFDVQHDMLLRSLRLAAGATAGDQEALHDLTERARTHDRWHHNIKPAMYVHWLEALITTAADFDPQWSDDVESAWRRTLGFVIGHMTKRYEGE